MFLVKNIHGHYVPSDDESYEQSKKIKVGGEVKATKARNVKHHRKYFLLIRLGYENYSKLECTEKSFRKMMQMKAGYFDPVMNGEECVFKMPLSIDFNTLSQKGFEELYEKVLPVIANELGLQNEELQKELNEFY